MALAPTPHLERGENIFLRGEQSQKKGMRMANRKLRGMMVRHNNSNSNKRGKMHRNLRIAWQVANHQKETRAGRIEVTTERIDTVDEHCRDRYHTHWPGPELG